MATGYTVPLTIIIDVEYIPEDAQWEAEFNTSLASIEPRNVFGKMATQERLACLMRAEDNLQCTYCTDTNSKFLCDACAAEEMINNIGGLDFLENCKIKLPLNNCQITVKGKVKWQAWSSQDGDDWDEEFILNSYSIEEEKNEHA